MGTNVTIDIVYEIVTDMLILWHQSQSIDRTIAYFIRVLLVQHYRIPSFFLDYNHVKQLSSARDYVNQA